MTNAVFPVPFETGLRLQSGEKLNNNFQSPILSSQDGITAHAGGGQTNAFALVAAISRIATVASANDSVMLPRAIAGTIRIIDNDGANTLAVFPNGSDTIEDSTSAQSLAAGQDATFICPATGKWYLEGSSGIFSSITLNGPLTFGAGGYLTPNPGAFVPSNVSAATGTTITALQIAGGAIARTGTSAAFSDTTDTAANILALILAQIPVGYGLYCSYANNTNFPATLLAGSNVTISNGNIIPANSTNTYLLEPTSATALSFVLTDSNPNTISNAQFATNTTTTTFAAGQITGSGYVVYTNTGATPGTINTRTAPQMLADMGFNAVVGTSWILRVINGQGTGTLTIGAGSGVTVTGTATIAANTTRDFVCTVTATGTPAITLQNIGTGTFS